MAYEVGKLYTFKENEFEKSRESGKLVFKLLDSASATPYIVKPFEFQILDIPDELICVYKGHDRFEQDQKSLIPKLYKVGEEYRFRVMRQDNNASRFVSIRDDARGLTFYPMNLGKRKFERFQRITCRVKSTDNGNLKLECVTEQEAPKKKFDLTDLARLRGGRLFSRYDFTSKLLQSPVFDDARARFEEGNPEWVVGGLESMTDNIPMWFETANGRYRSNLLKEIKELTLSLIERSDYLNIVPMDERRALQNRLSKVILDSEDYLHAARLIEEGKDVDFITETLFSLKSTGWLYKPEKKMRLMMALFTLKNSYAHDYIWEIFNVINDHNDDRRFLDEFADGFILMLQIFIDNESKFLNSESRDAIRALIEAIAIQLLLTQNKEYSRWNIYRGQLYTLAMLLIGTPSPALTAKGLAAFTDTLDAPLEYGWKDLRDVNRLCHVCLNMLSTDETHQKEVVSTFDGQNASLSISNGKISLTPAIVGTDLRSAIYLPISGGADFSVFLNQRFDAESAIESGNLSLQHVMWRDMERSLFDPEQNFPTAEKAKMKDRGVILPEVDDEVTFRVVARDDKDKFTFHCVIEDNVFAPGKGIINSRDIVVYPVTPHLESFWTEEGQMLFRGRVIELLPDGQFRFSLDKEADEVMKRMAQDDINDEAEVSAIITKNLDADYCLAVTDLGYPVIVNKRGESLGQSQKVNVKIDRIGWNKKGNRPSISATFLGLPDDINDPIENYNTVCNSFHTLLDNLRADEVYVPSDESETVVEEVEEVKEEVQQVPELYLEADAVSGISRLLDAMACVTHDNITEVYSLLAASRLMALLTGDTYRAQFLELKQSLVEVLSGFAINGRADSNLVRDLEGRVHSFPGNDADLNRRLEILKILSTLDTPSMGDFGALPDETDQSVIGSLKRLVVSYNMLRGLKLNSLRQELRRKIYDLLNIEMPDLDISRVNAREDQHHEFKESLIFPAGNNMKPDEKKQGREIAEVICGMLNSEGGTLYIGVANTGVPRGLVNDFVFINNGFEEYDLEDVKDKFALRFCKILRDNFGLSIEGRQVYPSLVTLEFDDIDDHCFAVVSVRSFPGLVHLTDDSVYIRQDSSTLPLLNKTERQAMAASRAHL